ncbi:hypothetical protein BIW11_12247 [Tropilaelaps mercedesae]|uniref:Resistance to inhibitors of cholinesterase protein 3 N-terminal domain-containing protein n=1 Tax=Tropilaelaps mercedesae TaxID=418985 RepID=A0A1V9X7U0_9ACAR|nr:hypothetical protein BIW11_12247 [Tropilaelaps mercedesae]
MAVGVRLRSGSTPNGLTTGRAVAVLAVVVGCLGVLWPKIFYPMLMVALRGSDRDIAEYPPPMAPRGPMAARLQQSGKRIPPPHSRMSSPGPQGANKSVLKSSSFNIIMPVYTLGIIVVFVYMIFKIMSRGDKDKVDLDRLAYNERSRLGQQAITGRRGVGSRDGPEAAKGQNNNFEPPKRNKKDPRTAFENNTKMVLKMYGKDKMLDALNVVVNEMQEYKKQAIELAKQLEEHRKTANKSHLANEPWEDNLRERATSTVNNAAPISDQKNSKAEVKKNFYGESADGNDKSLSPHDDPDKRNIEEQEDALSDVESERNSEESNKDIGTQPGEEEYDEKDDAFDEVDGTDEVEIQNDEGDDGTKSQHMEDKAGCPEGTQSTEYNLEEDKRNESVKCGPKAEQQVYVPDFDDNAVYEDILLVNRDHVQRPINVERPSQFGDQEDENDVEVEEFFGLETSPGRSNMTSKKKVMADKCVYAKHPECLCRTPQEDETVEEHEIVHEQITLTASTIDDICRNQEGLQFLDHATDIEPGTKLHCYDDVIYGQCITERTSEATIHLSKDGSSQNGLQLLQDLITKDRDNESQESIPTDYQQWKSITPEDLFKTATAVVEKTDEGNANRDRNSRRYRSDNRNNIYYQNGLIKPRLPPQNFYYGDPAPIGNFEESGRLRRRTRRARRAD